jgi:hypothetical protein
MRTSLFILFFLIINVSLGQAQSITTDKQLWTFSAGHTYDFEWTKEQSDYKFFNDTLYAVQFFPTKNDWKIYFDASKTKIATLVHYDSIKKTINTKHFSRQGKLIKELEANYINKKTYNPAFFKIKNIIYMKSYVNDSLICEIKGMQTSIVIKYNNQKTKKRFEKKVFYKEDKFRDEEIGEITTEYFESGNKKSICDSYSLTEMDEQGNQYSVLIPTCTYFDINGCILKDK